jgi:hypothetical protein
MDQYIDTAIEFQKKNLKEPFPNVVNKIIKPELIDQEMNNLKEILLNLTNDNHKEYYQKISNEAKEKNHQKFCIGNKFIRTSHPITFMTSSNRFAIIEYYAVTDQWKITIEIHDTKWNELNNENIKIMVQKFVPYFSLEIQLEDNKRKYIVISEMENSEYHACEDLLIPLAKMIRLFAEANIII